MRADTRELILPKLAGLMERQAQRVRRRLAETDRVRRHREDSLLGVLPKYRPASKNRTPTGTGSSRASVELRPRT